MLFYQWHAVDTRVVSLLSLCISNRLSDVIVYDITSCRKRHLQLHICNASSSGAFVDGSIWLSFICCHLFSCYDILLRFNNLALCHNHCLWVNYWLLAVDWIVQSCLVLHLGTLKMGAWGGDVVWMMPVSAPALEEKFTSCLISMYTCFGEICMAITYDFRNFDILLSFRSLSSS